MTIETWKAIAHHCSRSERWCRVMASRESDPLPIRKVCGTVRADPAELAAWFGRQVTRPGGGSLRGWRKSVARFDHDEVLALLRAGIRTVRPDLASMRITLCSKRVARVYAR